MNEIIYQENDISIEVTRTPNDEAIKLLTGILWGTTGAVYKKIGDEDKIAAAHQPYYILLKKEGKVIGTCTLSERPITIDGKTFNSFYLRHFAVEKTEQGQKYGKNLLHHVKRYFVEYLPKPFISYAIIEGGNIRSQKSGQFIGYESVGGILTQTFSRIYPKKHPNVRRATMDEKDEILARLKQQYHNYAYAQFVKLLYKNDYFVLEENGKIVAGVQTFCSEWSIQQMPGMMGKVLMNVVPKIPVIKRIFNPPSHKFIGFESILCETGAEDKLFQLLEATLAEFDVTLGLSWFDARCPLYQRMQNIGKWGLVHKIEGVVPAMYVAKYHGLPNEDFEAMKSLPIYVSAFDCV